MLRILIYALTLLHLGPGFAFAVLAFGCDPITPALGGFCAGSQMRTFMMLTAWAWVVMAFGVGGWHLAMRRRRPS